MSNFWKEFYWRDCTFYVGLLEKGNYNLGISLGNRITDITLIKITFGFQR